LQFGLELFILFMTSKLVIYKIYKTIELVFRVLALMLIAAFSMGISSYYSKIKGETKEVNQALIVNLRLLP